MSTLLSAGTLSNVRHSVESMLVHRYTRSSRVAVADNPLTPGVDESVDSEGLPQYTNAPDVPNLPCLYEVRKTVVAVGPNSLTTIDQPVLVVPAADPIAAGDTVKSVHTTDGIYLVGSAFVEFVNGIFPSAGGPIYSEANLRLVETVR